MPLDMRKAALSSLAEEISRNLVARGIYLLSDSQLELIGGLGGAKRADSPELERKVTEFAAAHGWTVTRQNGGFLLLGSVGEMDFSHF
jgi:hypothetical protein